MEYETLAKKNDAFVQKMRDATMAYVEEQNLSTAERSTLARIMFDAVENGLLTAANAGPTQLRASNAVLEILDEGSGLLFRRWLELEFEENSNGIRLQGETMAGQATSIVFLSAAAIEKINELKGDGPDKPKCDDH